MTPSRILSAAFVGLLLATTAACSSTADDPVEAPAVQLQGVYQSTSDDGSIALIEFDDGARYRAWRFGGGPCASLAPGEAVPDSCAETGTYALAGDELALTDERTHTKTTFHMNVTAFVGDGSLTKPASLEPSDLVTGGQQLAKPGQPTVAQKVQITDQSGKTQELVKPGTKGMLCRAACWGAAGLGTAAVSLLCTGASVITVGGLAIPCGVAIVATGGALGAGASLCSDGLCPP